MMNFKLFGTGFAALALLASSFSAQAADIPRPVYKGSAPVVAYYNWTGFYVGINAGYGFGKSDWSRCRRHSIKPKGYLVGGTLGYNYQVGSIVYGLEGDFDWSDVKDSVACAPGCRPAKPATTGSPRSAAGSATPSIAGCRTSPAAAPTATSRRPSARRSWACVLRRPATSSAGPSARGLEYAFLGNWTAKIEYLYVDLGSFDTGPAPLVNNVTFKENIVRAGLNYKFSGPIFTRY